MSNKLEERMEKRGLKVQKLEVNNNNQDIIMDNNIFNIIEDESKLIQWKNVEFENKKKYIRDFIDKKYPDCPDNIYDKIVELVKNNKINFKKYINYDPISEIIISLPILEYDELKIENKFRLNYSNTKKIKRKKITFK